MCGAGMGWAGGSQGDFGVVGICWDLVGKAGRGCEGHSGSRTSSVGYWQTTCGAGLGVSVGPVGCTESPKSPDPALRKSWHKGWGWIQDAGVP